MADYPYPYKQRYIRCSTQNTKCNCWNHEHVIAKLNTCDIGTRLLKLLHIYMMEIKQNFQIENTLFGKQFWEGHIFGLLQTYVSVNYISLWKNVIYLSELSRQYH